MRKTKLNWRLVLMHTIAFWFFIFAASTYYRILDIDLYSILRQVQETGDTKILSTRGITLAEMVKSGLHSRIASIVGLFVAATISLLISVRKGWYWMNTLLAFGAAGIVYFSGFVPWSYITQPIMRIGRMFNDLKFELIVNGTVFLLIAITILFLRPINRFIGYGSY